MKQHALVGMLIINSFFLGVNIMGKNEIGITCSLLALGLFGWTYIDEIFKRRK